MIVVMGDLHGNAQIVVQHAAAFVERHHSPVIQVGDLDWHPDRPTRFPFPVHFIDGNHDHLPSLLCHEEPTEVANGLIYCPRGSTLELDGKRVGFFGGARSVDREFRIKDETWWEAEEPTWDEAQRLLGEHLDLLVTHTPPLSVVYAMGFEASDRAATVVQRLWEELGEPPLVCGHMHRRFHRGNVTVLGSVDVDVVE